MAFPTNPIDGQKTVQNHITYVYSTSTNSWRRDFNNALDKLFIVGNFTATSTTTGALVVFNGVGIGGDLHIGGNIYIGGTTVTPAGIGLPWLYISSNYVASPSSRLFVDTTTATVTVTLPATPDVGAYVQFIDYAGTFQTNNLIFDRNSQLIMGLNEDLNVDVNHAGNKLVYTGSVEGWKIENVL